MANAPNLLRKKGYFSVRGILEINDLEIPIRSIFRHYPAIKGSWTEPPEPEHIEFISAERLDGLPWHDKTEALWEAWQESLGRGLALEAVQHAREEAEEAWADFQRGMRDELRHV